MSTKALKRMEASGNGRVTAHPGARLKALRMQRGWTLAEVSKRTGLPVSTLSKIENERMSLSYDKLALLSAGLGVDISQLFAPPLGPCGARSPAGAAYTLAGEGQIIETDNYGHIYPAADFLNKRFVPIIAELHARSLEEFGELIRHPGEEYAYVLEGTVVFHTELYAPLTLRKGDSIYFDSGMGHAYLAAEPGPLPGAVDLLWPGIAAAWKRCSAKARQSRAARSQEQLAAPERIGDAREELLIALLAVVDRGEIHLQRARRGDRDQLVGDRREIRLEMPARFHRDDSLRPEIDAETGEGVRREGLSAHAHDHDIDAADLDPDGVAHGAARGPRSCWL